MSQDAMTVQTTIEADAAPPAEQRAAGPNRWVIQLVGAALVICLVSGLVFYLTARSIFNRKDDGGGAGGLAMIQPPVDPSRNVVSLEHGLAVFAANCAMCHGPQGLGDGPQAGPLDPKPRNFSGGSFKIGTTVSGLPTDDDIAATIRHGMLPAAMPPWPQLTDGEVRSVVMAVRHLAIEGRVADKLKRTPNFGRDKALAMAHAALDSGAAIVLPPKPARIDPDRGKSFYLNNCAVCHDPDGRGKLRDDLVDNDENPIRARDFTAGQFKGGTSLEDIAMRIVRGIPGTPMPTNPTISADDLWSTAAYVRAFFDKTAK